MHTYRTGHARPAVAAAAFALTAMLLPACAAAAPVVAARGITGPEASSSLRRADAARGEQRAIEVQLRVLGDLIDDARGARLDELARRRVALEVAAKERRSEAIRGYAAFVDDRASPAAERSRARLTLARALQEAGDDAAVTRWEEVLADPTVRSEIRVEAHLALADLQFAGERLEPALAHCEAVIRDGTPPQRQKAHYIKSWALRGLGDGRRPGAASEATASLEEVVRLGAHDEPSRALVEAAEAELGHGRGLETLERRGGTLLPQ